MKSVGLDGPGIVFIFTLLLLQLRGGGGNRIPVLQLRYCDFIGWTLLQNEGVRQVLGIFICLTLI